jgi:FtsZ-binding cell division protein ZapB
MKTQADYDEIERLYRHEAWTGLQHLANIEELRTEIETLKAKVTSLTSERKDLKKEVQRLKVFEQRSEDRYKVIQEQGKRIRFLMGVDE